MRFEHAYVYLLANTFHRLYTGVTTDLDSRIHDHKAKRIATAFTTRYNTNRLVHREAFANIETAIAREKEIKGWLRIKKITFIVNANPEWRDLSLDWNQPTPPFDEGVLHTARTFGA